ncbi:unnamed protein product [Amoebophrya sp. A25]|nr:unnamed protein product [Amoebophrya sp. A25]|eukprot:GSA25T00009027001.1
MWTWDKRCPRMIKQEVARRADDVDFRILCRQFGFRRQLHNCGLRF